MAGVDRVMQRVRRRKRPFGPEGVAWLERAHAEHLRLRWLADVDPPEEAELVAAWQRTVAAFEEMGQPYETARSQARLAAVLRADRARRRGPRARRRGRDAWPTGSAPSRCWPAAAGGAAAGRREARPTRR